MKSLNHIKTRMETISELEGSESELMEIAFDRDKFKAKNPAIFEALYEKVNSPGYVWLATILDGNRYLFSESNGYLIIFDFADRDWYKKSAKNILGIKKKNKPIVDWRKLEKSAIKTKDMSNEALFQHKEVKTTIISLKTLLGAQPLTEFNIDFINSMTDVNVQKVFEKKFTMESHRVFLEIEKLLKTADPSDNFYEDLKLNYDKSKKAYHDSAVEYLEELHRFQKEFRQQEHLKVLSLVQETGE